MLSAEHPSRNLLGVHIFPQSALTYFRVCHGFGRGLLLVYRTKQIICPQVTNREEFKRNKGKIIIYVACLSTSSATIFIYIYIQNHHEAGDCEENGKGIVCYFSTASYHSNLVSHIMMIQCSMKVTILIQVSTSNLIMLVT